MYPIPSNYIPEVVRVKMKNSVKLSQIVIHPIA